MLRVRGDISKEWVVEVSQAAREISVPEQHEQVVGSLGQRAPAASTIMKARTEPQRGWSTREYRANQ